MKNPLISIITVVYNNAAGIEKTLQSVLNQQYPDIEYIVIDGNSNDGTKEIIEKYRSQLSTFISEPDQGIYDAMNKGLKLAKGTLIGMINSGDFYEETCVSDVVAAYQEHPDADIFHGVLRVFELSGAFNSIIGNHSSFLSQGMIQHPTCFVKKALYEKFGYFSLAYRSSSDYEFMLRMRGKHAKFHFIEKILANFYNGGMSSNTKAVLETVKIRAQYGLISPIRKNLLLRIIKIRAALKK